MKIPKITDKELHITKRNLPHWQLGGSWYFVTFRTRGIELDSNSKDVVLECVLYSHGVMCKMAIAIIMSDHVHLLFRPIGKDKENYFSLTEIIQPIKSVSAHKINRFAGRKGSIWLDEFFDRIIRNEREWAEKYNYIKNNAVKAGHCIKPEDYPWLLDKDDFIKRC